MEVEAFGRFDYKLVEIVGQPPLPPSLEALEKDPLAQNIDVEGKTGQTLDFVPEQEKYVVETFGGELVAVREEYLKEYFPPTVSDGGFDLAFPGSEGRAADFQADIATLMAENKYCVVQMTYRPDDRKAALRQINELDTWQRFMPEFENTYMGRRPDGKRVQWYNTDYSILEENPELESIPGLETVNQQLSNLATCICNVAPYLGFTGVCRSNALLHMNCASSEEEMTLIDDARSNAVGAGLLKTNLAFFHRRKVCMFYFVSGSGGTLTLHPPNKDDEDIVISCQEGQAIVFRHDLMDYTYLPEGRQLAMQAWVFREEHAGEVSMSQPDLLAYADMIDVIPRGPSTGNTGKTIDNMAFGTRLPGLINQPESYWSGLTVGLDGIIRIPFTRWDHDIYWHPDPEESQMWGKAYIQHEGMLDNEVQMFSFDNEFFGLTEHQVRKIDPNARCLMEVGYDCLYRAGYTRQNLKGASLVAVHGLANSEFSGQQIMGVHMPMETDTYTMLHISATASRLHYIFGMQGRTATVETACSSSLTAVALVHTHLRPDELGQMKLGAGGSQTKAGFATGANGHFDPGFMVGLCGAKMLSIQGRCFTFDSSGDGFCRGEGHCAMYFKCSEGEDLGRLAMLCGTCMNQDGRSASMTAPHGPSQQECIRHSLREAMISALDIQIQELHGTGTALGDPIEVGALRATMMTWLGEVREHPLVKTSSKSNLGHTEMCAGILGIMKCVIMANQVASAPNVHMRLLNPHMDTNAYPVYFSSEFVDQGKDTGYMGVSSFGFGGSNARGDIWARAQSGYRNTNPGGHLLDLSWNRICKFASLFTADLVKPGRELPLANENWQDFAGDYLTGDPFEGQNAFYVEGTFNGFRSMERMHYLDDMGGHAFPIVLGDTLMEQFRIVCNRFDDAVVFPMHKFADQEAMVLGPGEAPAGYRWVIDGRESAKQGEMFLVVFKWDPVTKQKRVTWEMSNHEGAKGLVESMGVYKHFYSIVGSWNNFRSEKMKRIESEKPGTHAFEFRIGLYGHEEFHLQRDGDKYQTIYPAKDRSLTRDVPVRGPDHFGEEKYWSVVGETGELVRVELEVHEGNITVTLDNKQQGVKKFQSLRGTFRRKYHVYSQWSDWGFTPMGLKDKANTFKAEMTMPEDGPQSFQIVIDENVHQAYHPELEFADQLMSPCQGPDGKGLGMCWSIDEEPGTRVEITLDLNASDRREVVTWKAVSSKQALAN